MEFGVPSGVKIQSCCSVGSGLVDRVKYGEWRPGVPMLEWMHELVVPDLAWVEVL